GAGALSLDESAVSGADSPVARDAGEPIVAGTRAVAGEAVVEVKRAGRQRALAHARAAVPELQGSSAPLTRLAARAAALAPFAARALVPAPPAARAALRPRLRP